MSGGVFGNERDVEVPDLLAFVERHRVGSLLDVGAHWSHAHYARQLRRLVKVYHGVDILPDPQTAEILDAYHVGNVLDFDSPGSYDCVVSVSTLEHCGISTYRVDDYRGERDQVFEKCLSLARRHVWLSFPVGKPFFLPGEFANVTGDCLDGWVRRVSELGWRMNRRFFYLNDDGRTYRPVAPGVALGHEYDLSRIQQSFCIMTLAHPTV